MKGAAFSPCKNPLCLEESEDHPWHAPNALQCRKRGHKPLCPTHYRGTRPAPGVCTAEMSELSSDLSVRAGWALQKVLQAGGQSVSLSAGCWPEPVSGRQSADSPGSSASSSLCSKFCLCHCPCAWWTGDSCLPRGCQKMPFNCSKIHPPLSPPPPKKQGVSRNYAHAALHIASPPSQKGRVDMLIKSPPK